MVIQTKKIVDANDKYYGAALAGPVFKAVADKLMTIDQALYASYNHPKKKDSSKSIYSGASEDFKLIAKHTGIKLGGNGKGRGGAKFEIGGASSISVLPIESGIMPDLKGYGLKDALELLERQQLLVVAVGKGKVTGQSIPSGTQVYKGQTIYLDLGGKID